MFDPTQVVYVQDTKAYLSCCKFASGFKLLLHWFTWLVLWGYIHSTASCFKPSINNSTSKICYRTKLRH